MLQASSSNSKVQDVERRMAELRVRLRALHRACSILLHDQLSCVGSWHTRVTTKDNEGWFCALQSALSAHSIG